MARIFGIYEDGETIRDELIRLDELLDRCASALHIAIVSEDGLDGSAANELIMMIYEYEPERAE
jgi:hypothetical protein